jgi:hypothetical protein
MPRVIKKLNDMIVFLCLFKLIPLSRILLFKVPVRINDIVSGVILPLIEYIHKIIDIKLIAIADITGFLYNSDFIIIILSLNLQLFTYIIQKYKFILLVT